MMNGVSNIIKMDLAICRKSMVIMTFSMLAAGVCCLFFLTPLLLGLFVVGSTAVVSAVFAVENKSNMEFFYGCFPIQKWEYIVGRSLTCLLVMAIPSLISIIFMQIEKHFSLCRVEDVRIIMEIMEPNQMLAICAMIMIGFIGGANLLLVSFIGKIESREMLEVILLLVEALVVGVIVFFIQKIKYPDDKLAFSRDLIKFASDHEGISCILLIFFGLMFFLAATLISLKMVRKKQI